MKAWTAVVAVAALWAPAALAQDATSLALNCVGTDAVISTVTPYGFSGRTYYSGGVAYGETRAAAQMSVVVEGGKVRVRPPKTSVPLFARDGTDGWYELTDVAVDRLAIRGRVKWNRLDRARLEIDRRTGQATFGAFLGTCQAVSANPDATKF